MGIYGLVGSFIIVAVTTFLGYKLAELTGQKGMGSVFAILLALVVAYIGGVIAHKQIDAGVLTTASKGITDVVYWIGSTSGTAGGLAAVDAKLVPYGAMVATFYTGLGCLLTPTIFTAVLRMIMG